MNARSASLVAVFAVVLAAQPARAEGPNCSGTLSGAVTGAFDCNVAMGKGTADTVSFVLTPAGRVAGTKSFAPAVLEFSKPIATKTYALESLASGKASLTTEKGAAFAATGGKTAKGAMTLTIANVERYAQLPGRYVVNGTYQARLVPTQKAKKGEVVVDVQFTVATDVVD